METKKQESKLNEEQQELLNRFRDHLAHVWEAYHVVNDIHKIAEQANDQQQIQIHLEWFARIFLRYLVVTVLHFFDNAGGTVAKSAFVNQADIDKSESEAIWKILKEKGALDKRGKINTEIEINQDNVNSWLAGKSEDVKHVLDILQQALGKQNLSIRFLKQVFKNHVVGILQQEKDNEKTATASIKSLKHLRNKYLAHNSVSRDDEEMKMTDKDAKEHIKILLNYCDRFCEKIDPTMRSLETAAGRRCYVQQLLNNGLQLSKYPKLSQAIRYPDENELLLKKLNSVAEDWTNN